jgi:hypothetical protein
LNIFEKALGSGEKSEDQPSIGKMPNTLDVRVVSGDTYFLFFEFHKNSALLVRAYVYYYISSQGAVCREDNASPLFSRLLITLCFIAMSYIIIVAIEFIIALVGVTLLIRFYNHKQ